jgi:hypothetical protein
VSSGSGLDDNTTSATTITRSTISRNTSKSGAGLRITGTLNLSNSTLSGNRASHGSGGAIWFSSKSSQIVSSTLHGNIGPVDDISFEKDRAALSLNSGGVTIRATIIDESLSDPKNPGMIDAHFGCQLNPNTSPTLTSEGYNIDRGASCGLFMPTDHPSTDPMLDPALASNGGTTLTRPSPH